MSAAAASRRKLTAIVACYRDEQAVPIMAERLAATFEKIGVDYEIIFVNDGSPDDTQAVLERLAAANPRIKAITHSRNFGSQNAFTSGMARATGDACILLDGDLQDPPELIEAFHAKWVEGYDVVYGVRTRREMPRLLELCYKGFYRLFQSMAYIRVPVDAGDFSLIDRKVMNVLTELPERDRFVRGLRAWTGFRQTGVPYVRPERMFGRSTNNMLANVRWAKKGIFSFSYVPLELISFGALTVSLLAALAMVAQIVGRIVHPDVPRGYSDAHRRHALFMGSITLVSLAFIAEYIGKIFEEVKQRPKFIVAKTLNLDDAPAAAAARAWDCPRLTLGRWSRRDDAVIDGVGARVVGARALEQLPLARARTDRDGLRAQARRASDAVVSARARQGAERAAVAEHLLEGHVASALALYREATVFHLAAYLAARTGDATLRGLRADDVLTRFRALDPPAPARGRRREP